MINKNEVIQFLESLQWKRFSKKELENELEKFFNAPMTLKEGTCEDCKDIDYSFISTTAQEEMVTSGFIDIEIFYLKMRKRNNFLITGTEILDYVA